MIYLSLCYHPCSVVKCFCVHEVLMILLSYLNIFIKTIPYESLFIASPEDDCHLRFPHFLNLARCSLPLMTYSMAWVLCFKPHH